MDQSRRADRFTNSKKIQKTVITDKQITKSGGSVMFEQLTLFWHWNANEPFQFQNLKSQKFNLGFCATVGTECFEIGDFNQNLECFHFSKY